MKTLIKSIIYLLDCAFEPFTYGVYVVKIVCQTSLPSFVISVSLAIFYLDQCEIEIACSAQHYCHWQER